MWEINGLSRDPWTPSFPCSLCLWLTQAPMNGNAIHGVHQCYFHVLHFDQVTINLISPRVFGILATLSQVSQLCCPHPGQQGPCTALPCVCNFLWKWLSDLSRNNETGKPSLRGEREGISFEYGWSSSELHLNPACAGFIERWIRILFFAFQPPSKVQEAVVFCIQTEQNLWNLWDKRAAGCQSGK